MPLGGLCVCEGVAMIARELNCSAMMSIAVVEVEVKVQLESRAQMDKELLGWLRKKKLVGRLELQGLRRRIHPKYSIAEDSTILCENGVCKGECVGIVDFEAPSSPFWPKLLSSAQPINAL